MLLRLGEAEAVQLQVSSQVLEEIEEVVRRKAAAYLPTLAVLLDRSRVSLVPTASQELLERCQTLIQQAGDARILADAWHSQVDFLVTLDRAHFLEAEGLADQVPFPIGTPGDCLAWYRGKLDGLAATGK